MAKFWNVYLDNGQVERTQIVRERFRRRYGEGRARFTIAADDEKGALALAFRHHGTDRAKFVNRGGVPLLTLV